MTVSGIVVGVGTVIVMMYSGLLFNPALMRQQLSRRSVHALSHLACVNYLLIPLATIALIRLLPTTPDLNLVLLTLAVMPCAPMVPAFVSMSGEAPDWPLFVFLVFSLMGILMIPVLLAVLPEPWAAGSLAQDKTDVVMRIFLFVMTGYLPLLLGIFFRLVDNARGLHLLTFLKPVVPVATLAAMLSILFEHWSDVFSLGLRELVMMVLSIFVCAVIGAFFGPRLRGAPMTNILPSGFRNITMALAFCNTVYSHTKATSYLFIFSAILLLIVFVASTAQRKMRAQAI